MIRLAWKNILHNPLSSLLSILLCALGIGLISFLFSFNKQFERTMEKNLAGIDLVLGAKGSPLQLILCNMYHVDAPTGNISIEEVKPFLNPRHPLIEQAVPVSTGDNYLGFRIVGTTDDFPAMYGAEIVEGMWFDHSMEAVLGAEVAASLDLEIGDHFKSSHGLINEKELDHTHDDEILVTGILSATGSVIDKLILTATTTMWELHEHGEHEHTEGEDHEEHHHTFDNAHISEYPDHEITALLIQFKKHNAMTLNMMRSINENTNMQAANPAWEINRLYNMVGAGVKSVQYIGWLIAFVAGLSVFITLLQSLRKRKYELAIMRVMGAGKSKLFRLVMIEGVIQVIMGAILGLVFSHVGLYLMSLITQQSYRYSIDAFRIENHEPLMLIFAVLLGVTASIFPAIRAYRTEVSKTLQKG